MMTKEFENSGVISLMSFIDGRADEMRAMHSSQSNIIGNNLSQQQLPRHMRRRAASHYAKRLPIRLREHHLHEQTKSNEIKLLKRPSRKFRRRSNNIVKEYSRRKLNGYWLETHIWHSRRFFIDHKWGWKVPMNRCDRGKRAAYRDAKNQCLIQDVSFTTCIEINGNEIDIVNKINQLIGKNSGPRFDSSTYIDGLREGHTYLYKRNLYPYSAIGPVSFLWQVKSVDVIIRRLWLFLHPSCHHQVLTELDSFDWTNDCSYRVLTNELCRFRLMGPSALKVLQNTLIDYKFFDKDKELVPLIILKFANKLKDNNSSSILNANLAPNIVLGGLVSDPRIYLPLKKITIIKESAYYIQDRWIEASAELSNSLIWNEEVRKFSRNLKATTYQFSQLKERFISSESLLSTYNPAIPILIIGKNNEIKSKLSQQWDLITPSSWGMSFWISLIYGGGKSIGHNEFASLCREAKHFAFPFDHPDTKSGQIAQNELGFEAYKKFCHRPPSKRYNYARCGVVSMFGAPWKSIFNFDDNVNDKDFFVLRDSKKLNELKNKLRSNSFRNRNLIIKCSTINRCLKLDIQLTDLNSNCLVPVVIKSCSRGLPKPNAGIYLMLPDDYTLSFNIKQSPLMQTDQMLLLYHKRYFKKKVSKLRNNENTQQFKFYNDKYTYEKLLSNMKPNINLQIYKISEDSNKILKASEEESLQIDWQSDINVKLVNGVRNLCSRELIGFVSSGGFSHIEGHGFGLGYVTIGGIKSLIEYNNEHKFNLEANILFRNTTSYVYYRASLNIIN